MTIPRIDNREQALLPPFVAEQFHYTLGNYSGQPALAPLAQNLSRNVLLQPRAQTVVGVGGIASAEAFGEVRLVLQSPPPGRLDDSLDLAKTLRLLQFLKRPQLAIALREMTKAVDENDMRRFLAAKNRIDWDTLECADFVRVIDLALAIGAFAVAREISNLAKVRFSEQREVREYARILSPPRIVRSNVPSKSDLKANRDWFKKHRSEYAGRWVALRSGELIESADSLEHLVTKIGNKATGVLLTRVE